MSRRELGKIFFGLESSQSDLRNRPLSVRVSIEIKNAVVKLNKKTPSVNNEYKHLPSIEDGFHLKKLHP